MRHAADGTIPSRGVMRVHSAFLCLVILTFDPDIQTPLSENLAQIHSAVSEILDSQTKKNKKQLEMWAQRDGRPVEYRWCPLFNAAVWMCSSAAKTRNPLKFAGVPQTNETISAASGPKFTIL